MSNSSSYKLKLEKKNSTWPNTMNTYCYFQCITLFLRNARRRKKRAMAHLSRTIELLAQVNCDFSRIAIT